MSKKRTLSLRRKRPNVVRSAGRLIAAFARRKPRGAKFRPGDPASGYYLDLEPSRPNRTQRLAAWTLGVPLLASPEHARSMLSAQSSNRRTAHPVSIAQLGIGAWQAHVASGASVTPWLDVVRDAAQWFADEMDGDGRIAYLWPLGHSFAIDPPWHSALAQGQGASLLVRAAATLSNGALLDAAVRAVRPLIGATDLVVPTPDGPVLQEYPTTPASHVLNGWIHALLGLYDVGVSAGDEASTEAFEEGTEVLMSRLPLYASSSNWSRYDLFPHRWEHVASPWYHRLHIEQLRVMQAITGRAEIGMIADMWERGIRSVGSWASAVTRKVIFLAVTARNTPPRPSPASDTTRDSL